MGLKALLGLIFLFAFSCLFMLNTSAMPLWITSNDKLYILTIMLWAVGFVVAFVYAEKI